MDFPGNVYVTQGNPLFCHSEPIPLTVWVWCLWVGVGVWELIPGGYPCPSHSVSGIYGVQNICNQIVPWFFGHLCMQGGDLGAHGVDYVRNLQKPSKTIE